jgi:hypothetical protein
MEQIENYTGANFPDASIYKKEAFRNSVSYLVEGFSSGSGPSTREHLCSWALAGDGDISQVFLGNQPTTCIYPDGRLPRAGSWSLDRAITFCSPICFGNLSRLALRVVVQEYCFDDDPEDLALIKKWELDELESLRKLRKKGKLKQKEYNRYKDLLSKHS